MIRKQKAGIVCCSNGLSDNAYKELQHIKEILEQMGITPVFSDFIYAKNGVRSGTARQRADALMKMYDNPEIDMIFDVSGGDIANEILDFLDYERIAKARNLEGQPKPFWGYSDLTVVLNAIYAKTGNSGVLYQVRHLAAAGNELRQQEFKESICKEHENSLMEACAGGDKKNGLFSLSYEFLQGTQLSGIVVGGNIRCLLKLAGTPYFPDMTDKVLLLEARSGLEPQMITYLSQLKQLGVFENVNGILLGTFTQLGSQPEELVKEFAGDMIPIVKTQNIGHAVDSKAIGIGKEINICCIKL